MPTRDSAVPSVPAPFSTAPLPPWKRVLDIACCLLALPAFAIAMTVLWAWTSITAPGPLFFRQERIGYLGRRFTLFKFRTMHTGADAAVHRAHVCELLRSNAPMRKMDGNGDKRLVPGGWIMRATGLDELPQLINVLRGDMSIVGPRPCVPYEYEQFTPRHRARFNAVPGLTGLWQVSGKNRTTFEEMIQFDIRYSETKSLALDLQIIARTAPALCRQVLDTRRQRRRQGDGTTRAPVPESTAATFQT